MNSLNLYIHQKWSKLSSDLLFTNSTYFLAISLFNSALSGIFWWIATQAYSADAIGFTVVLISTAQLITTTAQFGLSFSIIRFLPGAAQEQSGLINTALTFSGGLAVLISLGVILVGLRFSPALLPLAQFPHFGALFLSLVLFLVLFQLTYPILASLRAVKILLLANTLTCIGRILLLLFIPPSADSAYLLVSFIAPTAIASLTVILIILPRLIPGYFPRITFSRRNWRAVKGYSGLSYISNILHDLPYQLLPQIVAVQFGMASAAYFYITWTIFGLLTTLSNAVSQSLFVEGSHNRQGLEKLTAKIVWSILLITGIFALALAVISRPLLNIFGPEYAIHGSRLLKVIAFAAVPASIVYVIVSFLRVRKVLKSVIVAYSLIAIISLFMPHFIQSDVALASIGWIWLFAQLSAAAYLLVMVRRTLTHAQSYRREMIVVHPMDSLSPTQGGGVRYLMNIIYASKRFNWNINVIGIKRKDDRSNSSWTQIDLVSELKPGPLGRITWWLRYLFSLYFRVPTLRIPEGAIIITHRMDCMLPFSIFKPRNPKVLITATPAYYLRLEFPQIYPYFGWLYHFAERVCVRGVDQIIPTDPLTRAYYQKKYPDALITECIPSPINYSTFKLFPRAEARKILGWPEDDPIVIFVGRLAKVKNIPLLLQSFAKVEREITGARLVIIGEGESGSEIRSLAKSLCRRVFFTGEVDPNDICTYYSASNLLVLCSLEEGSPTVIKEALACGIPVVSTDVGDASLVLSSDPCLGKIAQSDVKSLAAGITDLLRRKDNEEMREKRRRAVQAFSTEITGLKIVEICDRVANRTVE